MFAQRRFQPAAVPALRLVVCVGGELYHFTLQQRIYTPSEGLPAGQYIVGVVADPLNEVFESIETNNTYFRAVQCLTVYDSGGGNPTAVQRWEIYR